ncbi:MULTISPECIES: hypothetical protein [Xanthomonas]|uniref:hypothetical protein n=1 Tax=Xanthomonas TaxID=338 RepID=UPI001264168E|nr:MULTISPECIES: hypothetical protein [Xanthomonas]
MNALYLAAFFAIPLSMNAKASCVDHPALVAYKSARQVELPGLDALTDTEHDRLESFYEDAWTATVDQVTSAEYGKTSVDIPIIYNKSNIDAVLAGQELYGTIGILADSSLSILTASELMQIADDLDEARKALTGIGQTFAEYNDKKYRKSVASSLLTAGCPSDLAIDYGLDPWKSKSTN